ALPVDLALAVGREGSLVGCSSGKAYRWDYQGQLLHVCQISGLLWALAITPSAHYMALATLNHLFAFFDGNGILLWERAVGSPILSLALSQDGQAIALGCENSRVYLFDQLGNEIWQKQTPGAIVTGVRFDANASR